MKNRIFRFNGIVRETASIFQNKFRMGVFLSFLVLKWDIS